MGSVNSRAEADRAKASKSVQQLYPSLRVSVTPSAPPLYYSSSPQQQHSTSPATINISSRCAPRQTAVCPLLSQLPQQPTAAAAQPTTAQSKNSILKKKSSQTTAAAANSSHTSAAGVAGQRTAGDKQFRAAAQLMEVCGRYQTGAGCGGARCRRVHVCKRHVLGLCANNGTVRSGGGGANKCARAHSLTSNEHNLRVCRSYISGFSGKSDDMSQLWNYLSERIKRETPDSQYISSLELCFRHVSRSGCHLADCQRLHFCVFLVNGWCKYPSSRGAVCRLGHSFDTPHNRNVLSLHRASHLSKAAVIDIIKDKLKKGPRTAKTILVAKSGGGGGGGGGNSGARRECAAGDEGGVLNELMCSVCLELLHQAVTLGCGHSVCRGCLQSMRAGGQNSCPLCRTTIAHTTRSVAIDNAIAALTSQ